MFRVVPMLTVLRRMMSGFGPNPTASLRTATLIRSRLGRWSPVSNPDPVEVGPLVPGLERRADGDDVDVLSCRRGGGQGQALAQMLRQQLVQPIFAEVGGAGSVHPGNKVVVGIVAGDLEARFRQDGSERQADVTGADDANSQGTIAHVQLLIINECSTKRPVPTAGRWD